MHLQQNRIYRRWVCILSRCVITTCSRTRGSIFYFTDINECVEDVGIDCEQTCVNTIGGYNCSCETGYQLQQDGTTCEGGKL